MDLNKYDWNIYLWDYLLIIVIKLHDFDGKIYNYTYIFDIFIIAISPSFI